MKNFNFNFIQLNTTPKGTNCFYNKFMQSVLQDIIKNDDICKFANYIKIPDKSLNTELYEHQSNILKMMNVHPDKSFLNLWDRHVGYSTMCAIYILYSCLIKKKNVLIIDNNLQSKKYLNNLIIDMYDSLPTEFKIKNFHISKFNDELCFETVNGCRSKILYSSWDNNTMDRLRGRSFDICIINDINEYNTDINNYQTSDLFDYINMMKNYSQIIIQANSIKPKVLLEFNDFIMTLA